LRRPAIYRDHLIDDARKVGPPALAGPAGETVTNWLRKLSTVDRTGRVLDNRSNPKWVGVRRARPSLPSFERTGDYNEHPYDAVAFAAVGLLGVHSRCGLHTRGVTDS
jgi:hypothetical protein